MIIQNCFRTRVDFRSFPHLVELLYSRGNRADEMRTNDENDLKQFAALIKFHKIFNLLWRILKFDLEKEHIRHEKQIEKKMNINVVIEG